MRINKEKRIGQVLFIVEGEKTKAAVQNSIICIRYSADSWDIAMLQRSEIRLITM